MCVFVYALRMVLGKELSISTSGKSSDRTNVRKIEFQSSIAKSHTPGPMVCSGVSGSALISGRDVTMISRVLRRVCSVFFRVSQYTVYKMMM
jgi:hypothetical protein